MKLTPLFQIILALGMMPCMMVRVGESANSNAIEDLKDLLALMEQAQKPPETEKVPETKDPVEGKILLAPAIPTGHVARAEESANSTAIEELKDLLTWMARAQKQKPPETEKVPETKDPVKELKDLPTLMGKGQKQTPPRSGKGTRKGRSG